MHETGNRPLELEGGVEGKKTRGEEQDPTTGGGRKEIRLFTGVREISKGGKSKGDGTKRRLEQSRQTGQEEAKAGEELQPHEVINGQEAPQGDFTSASRSLRSKCPHSPREFFD